MSQQSHDNIYKNRKTIFIDNLIGGVAWGIGATIGVSLLFAILGFIATQAGVVPIIGTFVSEIIDFVLKHNQMLQR